jgi:hypothetical protein
VNTFGQPSQITLSQALHHRLGAMDPCCLGNRDIAASVMLCCSRHDSLQTSMRQLHLGECWLAVSLLYWCLPYGTWSYRLHPTHTESTIMVAFTCAGCADGSRNAWRHSADSHVQVTFVVTLPHNNSYTSQQAVEAAVDDVQKQHIIPRQKEAFLCCARCCETEVSTGAQALQAWWVGGKREGLVWQDCRVGS